ncbi:MAG: hypothetical protein QNJ13_12365 [Paracoccaceae bacterium]|nr:hypothetical protein [Paracoccaceae bacterium]
MRYAVFALPLLLGWCDSGVVWRSAPYAVIWVDARTNRSLVHELDGGNSIGRVEADVVAVSRNAEYVAAIREADGRRAYYFVEIAKDDPVFNAEDITRGPFDEAAFADLAARLGLPAPEPL